MTLNGKSIGSSLCTVYLKDNENIFDIFFVTVGSIVTPSSPVYIHEGGIIKFSVSSSKVSEAKSKWFSKTLDNIIINSFTGEAEAIKEGNGVIMLSDTVQYFTKIKVIFFTLFLFSFFYYFTFCILKIIFYMNKNYNSIDLCCYKNHCRKSYFYKNDKYFNSS